MVLALVSGQASAQTLTTLASFDRYTNGYCPLGNVTLVGSTLYGMTPNEGGTIFSIPEGGGPLTTLLWFTDVPGSTPRGSLTLSEDGSTLYGTTRSGGTNGTIFSFPVGGGSLTTLHLFSGSDGDKPRGSLTLSEDGSTLYGTTAWGGANNSGTIFSFPVDGGGLTTLRLRGRLRHSVFADSSRALDHRPTRHRCHRPCGLGVAT